MLFMFCIILMQMLTLRNVTRATAHLYSAHLRQAYMLSRLMSVVVAQRGSYWHCSIASPSTLTIAILLFYAHKLQDVS